ncbi:uncharacterized protein CTRU02_207489 [Colletotrichum truncatum]|uniref:Uncharacterized protein n=1 Tax=Colletotrichum truncatum TaxID=5467 RepID=A0ACC3Z0Z3_COLTU|nr:uncharacterized protein CTRU02_00876 [Colletotrichum truncatum]KAF6800471.1 hypothetical protein CTRU02_00876 [Colletotrichum truncatum]
MEDQQDQIPHQVAVAMLLGIGHLQEIKQQTTDNRVAYDAENLILHTMLCLDSPHSIHTAQAMAYVMNETRKTIENAKKAEMCCHFIERLRNADAGNLCGRYLPDSAWFQRASQTTYNGTSRFGPRACASTTNHHHPDICPYGISFDLLYERYLDEHRQRRLWLQGAIGGFGPQNPPDSPWNEFFADVAAYSLHNDVPTRAWDYWRIVMCLQENYERARGRQVDYRGLLQYGWKYTKHRIDTDATIVRRCAEGVLSEDEKDELVQAVIVDARSYYYDPFEFPQDPARYEAAIRPRSWVARELAEMPFIKRLPSCPPPLQNLKRVWKWADVDEHRNVWVWCQYVATGDHWYPHYIGSDDGSNEELRVALQRNRMDQIWEESQQQQARADESEGVIDRREAEEQEKNNAYSQLESSLSTGDLGDEESEVREGDYYFDWSDEEGLEHEDGDEDGDDSYMFSRRQAEAERRHHQRDINRLTRREENMTDNWGGYSDSDEIAASGEGSSS